MTTTPTPATSSVASLIPVPSTPPLNFEVRYFQPQGHHLGLWQWRAAYGRWFLTTSNRTPIPNQIGLNPKIIRKTDYTNVFGHADCDRFATKLVGFAMTRGCWSSFTARELSSYEHSDQNEQCLRFFCEKGFLTANAGTYSFTFGFVAEAMAFGQINQ